MTTQNLISYRYLIRTSQRQYFVYFNCRIMPSTTRAIFTTRNKCSLVTLNLITLENQLQKTQNPFRKLTHQIMFLQNHLSHQNLYQSRETRLHCHHTIPSSHHITVIPHHNLLTHVIPLSHHITITPSHHQTTL